MPCTSRRAPLACALLLVAGLAAGGCASVAEGRLAPPVRGDLWVQADGKPVKDAKNLMKDRWSLVVVFRPNSAACVDGMGAVKALKARYGKDLTVVGVTAADLEDTVAFVKDHRIDFPVLAEGGEVIDHFGIPAVDDNHTYLVNPPGVVVVQGDLREADHILARYLRRDVAAK